MNKDDSDWHFYDDLFKCVCGQNVNAKGYFRLGDKVVCQYCGKESTFVKEKDNV